MCLKKSPSIIFFFIFDHFLVTPLANTHLVFTQLLSARIYTKKKLKYVPKKDRADEHS